MPSSAASSRWRVSSAWSFRGRTRRFGALQSPLRAALIYRSAELDRTMNLFKWLFSKRKEPTFDLPPEFLEDEAADWVIVLEGKGLPHRTGFSIRVSLSESSRTGTLSIMGGSAGQGQPATGGPNLERTEIDRLLVTLGFSFPQDITAPSVQSLDGLPVRLFVYRREPSAMKVAACNLAGWIDSKKPGPPVIEISRVLLGIQRRARPSPSGQ